LFLRVGCLVDHDLLAAQAESRREIAALQSRGFRPYGFNAASLAGLPEEARLAAKAFREKPGVVPEWDDYPPFCRRILGHAHEGLTVDVQAEIGPSRWKRFLAYDILGFAALGRGRREEAREWFRKAADHPPLFSISYP
jgi:hypothetical protein